LQNLAAAEGAAVADFPVKVGGMNFRSKILLHKSAEKLQYPRLFSAQNDPKRGYGGK